MKYRFLNILSTGLILLGSQSCTEEFPIVLAEGDAVINVEGAITTDTTAHKVIISYTNDPLNTKPTRYVQGAIVTITDGSKTFVLHESPNGNGVYLTDDTVYGVPGNTYTLNIEKVDIDGNGVNETYTASSFLNKPMNIENVGVLRYNEGGHNNGWAVMFDGKDLGGRHFYYSKVSRNNVLLTDSIKEYNYLVYTQGEENSKTNNYPNVLAYFIDGADINNRVDSGDVVQLEIDCVTEDYHKFVDGFQKEYSPKNPIFSGPSSNIITNIKPEIKSVGFFAAYAISRKSVVFKGEKTD